MVYKICSKNFETNVPQKSIKTKFNYFPYNSRSCNLKFGNKLIISGGVDHEKICYIYNYEENLIKEFIEMKNPRQMHSIINIENLVFFVGGIGCNKVDCYDLQFENLTSYPDLNYDRSDPGIGIFKCSENTYLYVFMGYSQSLKGTEINVERFKLYSDIDNNKWQMVPIQNPHCFEDCYVSHMGVVNYKNGFLFIGGIANTTSSNKVYFYDIESLCLEKTLFNLPFEVCFVEKNMFTYDYNDYYLISYGTNKLIKYDSKVNFSFETIDNSNE